MNRFALLAILAILFLLPLIAQADEACVTADTRAEIQQQLDLLEDNPLRALVAIMNLALAQYHDCSDDSYDFSGAQGAQPVLGPIALSPGLQRRRTSRSAWLRLVPLAFNCDMASVYSSAIDMDRSQITAGGQLPITSSAVISKIARAVPVAQSPANGDSSWQVSEPVKPS